MRFTAQKATASLRLSPFKAQLTVLVQQTAVLKQEALLMLPSQISHIHSFAGLPSVYGQRPAYVQMQGKLIYPHTTSSDLLPLFHWFLSSISHEGGCEKLKNLRGLLRKSRDPQIHLPTSTHVYKAPKSILPTCSFAPGCSHIGSPVSNKTASRNF